MSNSRFLAWLPATFCALTSITISTSASAEYNSYQPHIQQNYQTISFQHASMQAPAIPVIMPYVPFDNEPNIIPRQFNYQPEPHYQPQARTWRQTPVTHAPQSISPVRQRVLQIANQQRGIRYRWGGNTPKQGFDCSGFTKYAMKGSNVKIPRTAAEQSRASRTISRGQLRPGDLIFFKTKGKRKPVSHVGIYLGNGRFIHAASGGGKVMTDDLRKGYWQKRIHKYGTFLS